MTAVTIGIARIDPDSGAVLPEAMTAGASGMDVRAFLAAPLELMPGARAAVPTGFAVAIPQGWEIQVRPRSGLAFKQGVTVINAPGTIDSDYRGEVRILVANLSQERYTIEDGDRIAQLVCCPVGQVSWDLRASLENTDRGSGGFGSTGRR
jgi:dUTP diphosphatase